SLWEMQRLETPASAARSSAFTAGLFDITTRTRASSVRAATASRMACRLVPFPDTRTPTSSAIRLLELDERLGVSRRSLHLAAIPDALPRLFERALRRRRRGRVDHRDQADAEVERAPHLGLFDGALIGEELE